LDIGGESTRPGAKALEEEEEARRVIPIIQELSKKINIPISVDTRKAGVAERALEAGAEMPSIQILMERQHRNIVDAIRTGRIDLLTEPPVGGASDTTVRRRSPATAKLAVGPIDALRLAEKSLDEVIADWLAEQQHEERVRLRVLGGDDLVFGAPFSLQVFIQTTPGEAPVAGAHATVRFLSTAMKPTRLAEGTSDDAGAVELKGTIPNLEKGQGLLVVSVQHARGNDEVKFLVRR
jgi:hypothetical protein